MHAHRLGAIGFIAGLTLAVAGCGEVDDSVPNQSAAARAIAEKVKVDLEQDRLKRLAPRLAAANQSAESAPTAAKLSPAPVDTAAVKVARPAAEL